MVEYIIFFIFLIIYFLLKYKINNFLCKGGKIKIYLEKTTQKLNLLLTYKSNWCQSNI